MSDYPRPNYTADTVLFAYERGVSDLWVLLIERGKKPFKGMFALPGGFVNENEPSQEAASRELEEETGVPIAPKNLFPIGVFDDPERDPRGWVVSSAFLTIVDFDLVNPHVKSGGQDDAAATMWFSMSAGAPDLAFDHLKIISRAAAYAVWLLKGECPFVEFQSGLTAEDRQRIADILNFKARNDETETGQESAEAEGSDPTQRRMGQAKPDRAVHATGRKARREPEADGKNHSGVGEVSPKAIGRFEDDGGIPGRYNADGTRVGGHPDLC
jgi:ADP-ribose pyrophosphatase YjhB (NUDIX family)